VQGVDAARWGRGFFAVTSALVLAGLAIQLGVVLDADSGYFDTVAGRVFNMFCYFTIQSNVIVGVTCAALARDPNRRSTTFSVFRLVGVVDIAITGVVYHVAIADLHEFKGRARVADQILHTAVPIVAVVGWLVFGPRRLTSNRIVALAAIVPLAWLIFTLIRGPIVDFYPYEFIDVRIHGYATVFLNAAIVTALFVVLALGATALDRWLTRRAMAATSPA
jgi:hypothetical protein